MDLLWIAYSLTMSAALILAGMEVNRRLANRPPAPAGTAGAGTPPAQSSQSAGPAGTGSIAPR